VVRVDRRFHPPDLQEDDPSGPRITMRTTRTMRFSTGDMVWIEESKPISKLKRWTVVQGEKKKTA